MQYKGLRNLALQMDTYEKIVVQDADYLLAVKGNQKRLERALASSMLNSFEADKYVTQEKGHGRTETRLSMVVHNTDFLGDIALN